MNGAWLGLGVHCNDASPNAAIGCARLWLADLHGYLVKVRFESI